MAILEWVVSLAFGGLYAGIVLAIAVIGAVPYGLWQGLKRVRARLPGRTHGDS